MTKHQVYYRYDTSGMLYPHGGGPLVQALRVLRTTPAGVWVDDWGKERFILSNARKRFAYPTKEEALVSFIARKTWQLKHLECQMDKVKQALEIAKNLDLSPPKVLAISFEATAKPSGSQLPAF